MSVPDQGLDWVQARGLPSLVWHSRTPGVGYQPDRWQPVANPHPDTAIPKPVGGLWTSFALGSDPYRSLWEAHCRREGQSSLCAGPACRIVPGPAARIAVVVAGEGWRRIHRGFGLSAPRGQLVEVLRRELLDWPRLATAADALCVITHVGDELNSGDTSLAMWDVATVFWLQAAYRAEDL